MNADDRIRYYFAQCKSLLSNEAIGEIRHYLDHDEHEMAFEGLVLELISTNAFPSEFVFEDWESLAMDLGLRDHSVFDGDFWMKFTEWGHGQGHT